MKTSRIALLAALSLCITPVASADVIVPLVDGSDNSGWQAVLPDNVSVGIVVDRITDSYVRIEISKSFSYEIIVDPNDPEASYIFDPITIIFQQTLPDAQTVSTIQITDESITNNTGVPWTDYHWQIPDSVAAFNIDDTEGSNFSINPFTNITWTAASGWNALHASALDVDGGVVGVGETYTPGIDSGKLYINVDLDEDNSDFSFIQNPTPEPASMALMSIGALAVIKRRRK